MEGVTLSRRRGVKKLQSLIDAVRGICGAWCVVAAVWGVVRYLVWGNCSVGELWKWVDALWGSCGVSELWCEKIAAWESCSMLKQQFVAVAVSGSCGVWQLLCLGVLVWGIYGVGKLR